MSVNENQKVKVDAVSKVDAGVKARSKMEEKTSKLTVIKNVTKGFVFAAMTISLLGVLYVFNSIKNAPEVTEEYSRICRLPDDSGMTLSGYRNYVDTGTEVFNTVYKNKENSLQETYLLNNVDMSIAILNEDGSWGSIRLSGGGEGYAPLPKGVRYVFAQKDLIWVSDYEELCNEVY